MVINFFSYYMNNDDDDFTNYKLNELKRFITSYKKYHTITNFNRMNKATLIAELAKRFLVYQYKLYLKINPRNPKPFTPPVKKLTGKELLNKSKNSKNFKPNLENNEKNLYNSIANAVKFVKL